VGIALAWQPAEAGGILVPNWAEALKAQHAGLATCAQRKGKVRVTVPAPAPGPLLRRHGLLCVLLLLLLLLLLLEGLWPCSPSQETL